MATHKIRSSVIAKGLSVLDTGRTWKERDNVSVIEVLGPTGWCPMPYAMSQKLTIARQGCEIFRKEYPEHKFRVKKYVRK